MEKDQNFVEMVVKEIVDNPDKVKTERKVDEMGVLIELTVDPSDMGKIIGKEGKTAKAIRTLLRVLGAKEHARVNLKIIEPETGREVGAAAADESVAAPVASMDEEATDVTPLEESSTEII